MGSYNYSNKGFTEEQEDKSKRSLTSKHFLMKDGSYRGIFHCKPVHYIDDNNELRTIDLTINDDGSNYIMDKNRFSVGFRKDKSKEKYLGFRKGYDYQFEATIDKIIINGKELSFTEFAEITKLNDYELKHKINDDVWIHNRLHECYVKEAVVINTAKVPITNLEIRYKLNFKGFVEEDISGTTFRYKKDDADKFWIPLPEMWIEGNESLKHGLQHRIEKSSGNIYYIKYLDDADRKWVEENNGKTIYFDATTYYSTTADGYVKYTNGVWSTCRGAATGSSVNNSDSYTDGTSAGAIYSRGEYSIARSFFYFDTSGIADDSTVTGATINIYGRLSWGSFEICAQKGTQADTLTTADFDSFTGNYYGKVSGVSSNWNTITFDATGKSDISLTGATKICVREYTHDYQNSAPPDTYYVGFYWSNNTGTTYDPYLSVDYVAVYTRTVSAAIGLAGVVSTTSVFHATITAAIGLSASVSANGVWRSPQYWGITVSRGSSSYDLIDLDILKYASFSNNIGKRADEFRIEIYNNDGSYNDIFDVGDTVLIYLGSKSDLSDSTLVFKGYVTDIEKQISRTNENILLLQGEDYGSVRMRQALIIGAYEKTDTAISDIVTDLMGIYCPDITTTSVSTFSTNVEYVKFAWNTVWEAIEFLANLAGADYYVDEECDLHFYDSENLVSTHTFTDSYMKSLKIKKDSKKYFDSIYVVGGKEAHLDQSNTTTTTPTKIHDKYYATKFTPTFSNLLRIDLYVDKVGTHNTNIEFEVVEDNSGPLGDVAAYGTIIAENITDTAGWVKSTIMDARLRVGTDYWLVIPMIGDTNHTYQIYVDATGDGHVYSTDKSSWSNGTGKIAFKTYNGTQIIKKSSSSSKNIGANYTQNALIDLSVKDTTTAQELADQKIKEYALKNSTEMTVYTIYDRVRSGDLITINSTIGGINEDQVILSTEYILDGTEEMFSNELKISCTKSDDFYIHFAKLFEEIRKIKVDLQLESNSISIDYHAASDTISLSLTETIDEVLTATAPEYDDGTSRWDVNKWQ